MSKKNLLILAVTLFVWNGCATPNAVEQDSKVAWEGTKKVSGEVWEDTKEVSGQAWEGTKKVSGEAWEGTKKSVNSMTSD